MLKTFGKNGKAIFLQDSPNYKNGAFQNLESTPMMAEDASYFKIASKFFGSSKGRMPAQPFQFQKADLKALDDKKISLVWFGHSSYFLNYKGFKILVDPVLFGSASPFSFMVKAFEGTDLYMADDFPEIDLLLISHDHYDHLDYRFVTGIRAKVKMVICSLGVSSHLKHWNFPSAMVHELDWWNFLSTPSYKITAVPARHFSGRLLKRNQSLWSGFVFEKDNHKIFLGGDSGYGKHFTEIGNKFGPFDLAILECGQYNTSWPKIHMLPEETVQAALDLKAKILMPVHWGKFNLALHHWKEPAERVLAAAKEKGQNMVMPAIGAVYELGAEVHGLWWQSYQ